MQMSSERPPSLSPSVSSPGNGFYGDIDGWCEDIKEVADDIESIASCTPKSESLIEMEWGGNGQKTAMYCPSNSRFNVASSGQYENLRRVCLVCGDIASGLHYGIASCEACKAFFKRTVQGRIQYSCPASGHCEMNRKRRKACQSCRYKKCIDQGMNPDGIRPDRSKGGMSSRCVVNRPVSNVNTFNTVSRSVNHVVRKADVLGQGQSKILQQLLSIEPQKVYAGPVDVTEDGENKIMRTLANLVDRELVATIGWAKLVPGFITLPLADQMSLLQRTWLDILHLNFSYRSSAQRYVLVFSDDLKVSEADIEAFGMSPEFTTMTRVLANKLDSLSVTKEEYVLLKAIVLLNSDAGIENSSAVDSVRHQFFDALVHYEKSKSRRNAMGSSAVSSRRAGDLLLTLPLLTHQVAMGKEFWRRVKLNGHVEAHRLLDEMIDRALAS